MKDEKDDDGYVQNHTRSFGKSKNSFKLLRLQPNGITPIPFVGRETKSSSFIINCCSKEPLQFFYEGLPNLNLILTVENKPTYVIKTSLKNIP